MFEFIDDNFARLHANWDNVADRYWFNQSFLKRFFVGLKECNIGDTDLAES